MKDRFSRQKDLINSSILTMPITVVGAGGIGSFLVLTLAKMGFMNIMVFDPDTVEEHNLPNQFYPSVDVGFSKTICLAKLVHLMTDTHINTRPERWLSKHLVSSEVLISAVDNMDTREAMFNCALKNADRVPLFLDGRMGRLQAEVYVVNPRKKRDVELYKSRLWREDQVAPLKCTEKAIIYNCVFIASMMCAQLKLALEGKIYKPCMIADLANSKFTFLKES